MWYTRVVWNLFSVLWLLHRSEWGNTHFQLAWGLYSMGLLPGEELKRHTTSFIFPIKSLMRARPPSVFTHSPLTASMQTSQQHPASSWVLIPPPTLSAPRPPRGTRHWMSWTCWGRRCCSSPCPQRACRSNGSYGLRKELFAHKHCRPEVSYKIKTISLNILDRVFSSPFK